MVVAVNPYSPNDTEGPKGLPNCIGSGCASSADENHLREAVKSVEGSLNGYIEDIEDVGA